MSKYLEFVIIEQKRKKDTIEVVSKLHEDVLGKIKWFARWSQYAFFPETGTVFDIECLNDIQSYMKELR